MKTIPFGDIRTIEKAYDAFCNTLEEAHNEETEAKTLRLERLERENERRIERQAEKGLDL